MLHLYSIWRVYLLCVCFVSKFESRIAKEQTKQNKEVRADGMGRKLYTNCSDSKKMMAFEVGGARRKGQGSRKGWRGERENENKNLLCQNCQRMVRKLFFFASLVRVVEIGRVCVVRVGVCECVREQM